MAIAGRPAMAIPSMARMSRNIGQLPMTDESSVSNAAARSDTVISGLRDQPSATAPMTSIDTARQPVVTESARLLVAASTWNSRVNTGSSGCTAYISRNTENPAENTARLIFQKARLPRATPVTSAACKGETDAEGHQHRAGHCFNTSPDTIGQQHRGH